MGRRTEIRDSSFVRSFRDGCGAFWGVCDLQGLSERVMGP